MSSIYIATIEGSSGAGKSTLAAQARTELGGAVFEIGPLFRLAAAIAASSRTITLNQLRWSVARTITSESFDFCPYCSGEFAASSLRFRGRALDEELWDPRIEKFLPTVSGDPVIGLIFERFLREQIVHTKRAIIVGHEASRIFPERSVQIVLSVNFETGRDRKRRQLGYDHHLLGSLPRAERPSDEMVVEIDTTELAIQGVRAMTQSKLSPGKNSSGSRFLVRSHAGAANVLR